MKSRRNAFTLIELLVVVAIIALLVSILLPALGRARDLTKTTVCAMHMKSCGSAFELYAAEFNSQYPDMFYYQGNPSMRQPGESPDQTAKRAPERFDRAWWTILAYTGHLSTTEFIYCPGYKGAQIRLYTEADMDPVGWTVSAAWEGSYGFMIPWQGPSNIPDALSYPANIFADDHIVVDSHIKAPGNELILFDSVRYGAMPNSVAHTYEERVAAMPSEYSDADDTYLHNSVGLPGDLGDGQKWDGLSIRHGHATNALFFDSHVEKVDGETFWGMEAKEPDCMWDGY